jgi:ClpP class serine protease
MRKPHKLLRLTESLYSRPHLISQHGYDAIAHYLDARNLLGITKLEAVEVEVPDEPEAEYSKEASVGILNVHGALTYKPVYGLCGAVGTSYQQLLADAGEMLDAGVKLIVMDCDSGGGEGYGAFETANELRKMVDAAGAKLIAYNDGDCASACYALACAADEIVSNPHAETGSIGVLIALMNNSEKLKKEGYARTFVSAGDSKIPFDADGQFKSEFLADLQAKVDALYVQFCTHVSTHTGLSVEQVRNTQAKMFTAQDALSLGLINSVMTRSEFIDYIATTQTK